MSLKLAVFSGYDLSGNIGLWVSDGTVAGTHELTGIAGANATSFAPGWLVSYHGKVLFNGANSSGLHGLWVSDGTAAGTYELKGIAGANPSVGLYPTHMTAACGKVLFQSSGDNGLWVTDGTAAGTYKLNPAGAYFAGLVPSEITALNGQALFSAYDANGNIALWVTDGTSAGTYELTGIAGTSSPGIIPTSITAFNGKAYFSAFDANGKRGLWITDGSVAGTQELTGIVGVGPEGISPANITVFNGKLLFVGMNAGGYSTVWVSDGTANGTHELTDVSGANVQFLPSGLGTFTVFGDLAVFNGYDSAGLIGLWVTDGTAAGTHELTSIAGASTTVYGLNPKEFSVVGNEVLFQGTNASGKRGLWVTDGTAAGTHELTGIPGVSPNGLSPDWLTTLNPATSPAVLGAATDPQTGDEGIGKTVSITLTFSEAVTVRGAAPALTLNDGGTAVYASGSGTNTLTFSYTVASTDQSVSALAVAGVTNGTSVKSALGDAADFTTAITTFGGLQIDTSVPSVTQVTAFPTAGDEGIGKAIAITLTFSEPVTVTNSPPALTLNDGGTASYQSTSADGKTMTFSYVVSGVDQSVAALAVIGVENGAAVVDAAGNAADFTKAVAVFDGLQIDTVVPAVTEVAVSPSAGYEGIGKAISITLSFSEPVTVTGTPPALTLNDGGVATYQSTGADGKTLTFSYSVASADQNVPALAVTGATNGASVTDAAGNAADLTKANATFTGLQIDTAIPAIAAISAWPSSGLEQVGSTVTIAVQFSEAVTVAGGTPTLALNDGGVASYTGGSGTDTLTFTYTVGVNDQSVPALAVTGLSPNGAAIADAAGNSANLSGAAATFTGLQIGTGTPFVTHVSSSPPAGSDVGLLKPITVTVEFSKTVAVTGIPILKLNDGGIAVYTGGSGTAALTFTSIVLPGQNTGDLKVTSITLPFGASIKDLTGQAANLTGASNAGLGVQVDSILPTVASVSPSPSTADLNAGKTVSITLNMSEPVVVKGAPSLSLNDGGVAVYAGGSGTSALTFTYTVTPGENTASLAITKVNLPSGSSIQDMANNPALFFGMDKSLGLQIDTEVPSVSHVTSSPSKGTVKTGSMVAITLAMSEDVMVSGTAALLLNDGGTAIYDPLHSTANALVFDYSVPSSEGTKSLSVTGIEMSSPDAIKDGAGNIADLSKAGVNLGVKVNSITTGQAAITISGTQDAEIFGASSQNVTFCPSASGTLRLDAASSYTGTVSGLTASDSLDLASLLYGPDTTVGYSGTSSGGILSVSNGTQSAHIALLGDYLTSTFTLSSDGHGGTSIADVPQVSAAPVTLLATPS